MLEPGEQRRYDLEFGVVAGQTATDELVAGIATGAGA
jgi:hypothetical protein